MAEIQNFVGLRNQALAQQGLGPQQQQQTDPMSVLKFALDIKRSGADRERQARIDQMNFEHQAFQMELSKKKEAREVEKFNLDMQQSKENLPAKRFQFDVDKFEEEKKQRDKKEAENKLRAVTQANMELFEVFHTKLEGRPRAEQDEILDKLLPDLAVAQASAAEEFIRHDNEELRNRQEPLIPRDIDFIRAISITDAALGEGNMTELSPRAVLAQNMRGLINSSEDLARRESRISASRDQINQYSRTGVGFVKNESPEDRGTLSESEIKLELDKANSFTMTRGHLERNLTQDRSPGANELAIYSRDMVALHPTKGTLETSMTGGLFEEYAKLYESFGSKEDKVRKIEEREVATKFQQDLLELAQTAGGQITERDPKKKKKLATNQKIAEDNYVAILLNLAERGVIDPVKIQNDIPAFAQGPFTSVVKNSKTFPLDDSTRAYLARAKDPAIDKPLETIFGTADGTRNPIIIGTPTDNTAISSETLSPYRMIILGSILEPEMSAPRLSTGTAISKRVHGGTGAR